MSRPIEQKPIMQTALIRKNAYCASCGWPVVDACCNDQFCDFKDAAQWDWWLYCSNKGCKNHEGQGVFQEEPDWVVKVEEQSCPQT